MPLKLRNIALTLIRKILSLHMYQDRKPQLIDLVHAYYLTNNKFIYPCQFNDCTD
jgi:hypothetical protein